MSGKGKEVHQKKSLTHFFGGGCFEKGREFGGRIVSLALGEITSPSEYPRCERHDRRRTERVWNNQREGRPIEAKKVMKNGQV